MGCDAETGRQSSRVGVTVTEVAPAGEKTGAGTAENTMAVAGVTKITAAEEFWRRDGGCSTMQAGGERND